MIVISLVKFSPENRQTNTKTSPGLITSKCEQPFNEETLPHFHTPELPHILQLRNYNNYYRSTTVVLARQCGSNSSSGLISLDKGRESLL